MPKMSASSTVIFTRYWVISGRIRPDADFDSGYEESGGGEYQSLPGDGE
jgi:hypothetical protein